MTSRNSCSDSSQNVRSSLRGIQKEGGRALKMTHGWDRRERANTEQAGNIHAPVYRGLPSTGRLRYLWSEKEQAVSEQSKR
jgi:hypothetical protein